MVTRANRILQVAALTLSACAAQPSVDDLTSGSVVATKFAAGVDFGTFDTFAINPTVSVVRDIGDGGTLAEDGANGVVDRISSEMTSRGYQRVTVSERPSLGLQATVFLKLNTATTSSAGAWWGAPGYASTPAYWGYPSSQYFAPWSYATTAYKSGTLVIECVNLRDAGAMPDASAGPLDAAAGRLDVVWAAYAHAVTTDLLASFGPDALLAIDQAFRQSPYLRRESSSR